MSENDSHLNDDETVSKEQYNELVEKLADETQSKANLVAEIKDLREKKQISDAEATELRSKLDARTEAPTTPGELTPEAIAEIAASATRKMLQERDSEDARLAKEKAFTDFLSKHKEFHPDNDEGGLKLSSLERKLQRFNMDGFKEYKDYMSVFEDAANLVNGRQVTENDPENPNPLPPSSGGQSAHIKEAELNNLTSKEQKVIQQTFGGDKERYLKIKAKRPDYVASLLQYLV